MNSTPGFLNQNYKGWGPGTCFITFIPGDSEDKLMYLGTSEKWNGGGWVGKGSAHHPRKGNYGFLN